MVAVVGLLAALALTGMGCKAQPAEWPELRADAAAQQERHRDEAIEIVPQANREVADLSPDDVVRVMRRIGFTDEQIIEFGVEMHQALFRSGAARVVYKKETEAIVRIKGMQVYVGSRTRGNAIYDLGYGQFVTPGAQP
jgi:hypothetical protein